MEASETVSLRVIPTMTKAIRAKCIDCSAGDRAEVRRCPVKSCPLWQWRFGMSPEAALNVDPNRDVGQPKT